MKKLGDIGKIITGNTPRTSDPKNYETRSICFVKPSDIAEDKITRILCSEFYISEYAREKARIVPPESVLVTCIGSIGKVAISGIECAINQQINAIIPDSSKCNAEYLAYLLQYKKSELQFMANAPVVPILNKSQFSELSIELPSLDEQKIVNQRLNKITNIISLRQQQLAKLDELVKARFVEMFGDPLQNQRGWPTKSLLEMGCCKNGMNFHADDSGIEIRCLGVGDFKDLSVIEGTAQLPMVSLGQKPSEESMLHDGDIVFVRSNGNKNLVGRCVVVYPGTTPTTYSGFCIRYRLTCNDVIIPYLMCVLKSESTRSKMTGRGANIQNLNQQILATLNVPIPPMECQQKFADIVVKCDRAKLSIQKSLEQMETLKKALMQKYFG